MGRFDEEIAHFRKVLELDREYLEDLKSGKRTIHENTHDGRGLVDISGYWIDRLERSTKASEELIQAYEKGNK